MAADLIDVLSESGLRTGEVLPRADIHRLGKHHRAIHLYMLNDRDEILLQRRALTVDHHPGLFGISVTGHVNAGEHSSDCVRREVEEELGIEPAALSVDFLFSYYQEATLGSTYIDRQFNDVYLTRAGVDTTMMRIDLTEVSEVRLVPFGDFCRMVADESGGLAPVYANECRDLVYFLAGRTGR
jgi:isopentenyl-diphosphate Delta-isomerase